MNARKVFYGLISILVLLVIGGGFLYNNIDQQLNERSEEIRTQKAELAASDDRLRLTLQANSQFDDLSDINDIVGNILPKEKAQSDIVADVSALAAESGVFLNTISFNSSDFAQDEQISQTVDSEYLGLRKLPVTVVVNSSYNDLLDFMQEIESNQRKITVESLTINPDSDGFESSLIINFFVRTN